MVPMLATNSKTEHALQIGLPTAPFVLVAPGAELVPVELGLAV